MKILETEIEIVQGSVLEQDVQAIVNAANTAMRGGGGVDGAIHKAAGPGLMKELYEVAPNGVPTGEAILTGGHQLKQEYIIHTPGPVWKGGDREEAKRLRDCYYNSLRLAEAHGVESIAFCSISTGVYGYPIAKASQVAVNTVLEFVKKRPSTSLKRIVFALFTDKEYEAYQAIFHKLQDHTSKVERTAILHKQTGEVLREVKAGTLAKADLEDADLSGANLESADLTEANLSDADFSDANLKNARLIGAELMGTNFTGADLTGANLSGAQYDSRTRWPEGIDPAKLDAIEIA